MKPVILLVTTVIFFHLPTWAQSETITVSSGTDIASALSPKQLYRYSQFTSGKVYFKDGTTASGWLNLNLLLDEMQFINPAGDTLTVDNEQTIRYLTIATDSFYYQKGFLEQVAGPATTRLLKKQSLKELDKRKIGGYGMSTSTSAIANYDSYMADNTVYKLAIRGDILLAKKVDYYFGNSNQEFLPASKKNLMRLFPKHQVAISRYLQQNEVDYKNEADLLRLISFLQSL